MLASANHPGAAESMSESHHMLFNFELAPLQLDLSLPSTSLIDAGASHSPQTQTSPTKLSRKAASNMRIVTPGSLLKPANPVDNRNPSVTLKQGLPLLQATSPVSWDTLFRPKQVQQQLSGKLASPAILSAEAEQQVYEEVITPSADGKQQSRQNICLAGNVREPGSAASSRVPARFTSPDLKLGLKELTPTSPMTSMVASFASSTFGPEPIKAPSDQLNTISTQKALPHPPRHKSPIPKSSTSDRSGMTFVEGKVLHSILKQYDEEDQSDATSLLFESVETKAISSRELGTRVWDALDSKEEFEDDLPIQASDNNLLSFSHSPALNTANSLLGSDILDDDIGFRTTLSRRHNPFGLAKSAVTSADISCPIPPPLSGNDEHSSAQSGKNSPLVSPRELPSNLIAASNQDPQLTWNSVQVPSIGVAKKKLVNLFKKSAGGKKQDAHSTSAIALSIPSTTVQDEPAAKPKRKLSTTLWNLVPSSNADTKSSKNEQQGRQQRKLSLPTLHLTNKFDELAGIKSSFRKALGLKQGKSSEAVKMADRNQNQAKANLNKGTPVKSHQKKRRANRPPPIITGPITPSYQPANPEQQSTVAQVTNIIRQRSIKIPIRKFHQVSLNMLGLNRAAVAEGPKPKVVEPKDEAISQSLHEEQPVAHLAPHSACELQDAGADLLNGGNDSSAFVPKLNRFSRMRLPPVSLITSPLFVGDTSTAINDAVNNVQGVNNESRKTLEAPHSACDLHDTGNELIDSDQFVPKLNRFSRMRLPPMIEMSPHLSLEPVKNITLASASTASSAPSVSSSCESDYAEDTDLDTAPLFTEPIKSVTAKGSSSFHMTNGNTSRRSSGHLLEESEILQELGNCLEFLPALETIGESMLSASDIGKLVSEDDDVPLGQVFPSSSLKESFKDEDIPLSFLSPTSRKKTHKPFDKILNKLDLINFDSQVKQRQHDDIDTARATINRSSEDEDDNAFISTSHLLISDFDVYDCIYEGMPRWIERNDMAQIQLSREEEWSTLSVKEMKNRLPEVKFQKKMRELICNILPHKERHQIWFELVTEKSLIPFEDFAARYNQMKFKLTEFDSQITHDVCGVMLYHKGFSDVSVSKRCSLQRVLRVLLTLTPDLIYSESLMSWVAFLVAVFPLEDEAKVCWLAKTLLETPFYGLQQRMFRGQQSKAMNHQTWVHEALLSLFAPHLAEYLNQNHISHAEYLTRWVSSAFLDCFKPALTASTSSQVGLGQARIYSKSCSRASSAGTETHWAGPLDFETILSIWDMLLLHGEIILLTTPIALLKYYEAALVTKSKSSLEAFFGISQGDESMSLPCLGSERLSRHVSGGMSRHFDSRRNHQIFLDSMMELLDSRTRFHSFDCQPWLESVNPISCRHLSANQQSGRVIDDSPYKRVPDNASLDRPEFRSSPKKEHASPPQARKSSFASSLLSETTVFSSEHSTLMNEILGCSNQTSSTMDFLSYTRKQHQDLYFGLDNPLKVWNKLESFETGWDLVRFLMDDNIVIKHDAYHRFI